MQEGFRHLPMRMRQNRAKGEVVEVEGGGRIIRSLGRKDRHSKVCTSKGPKDRRVRLSADTAIQFYDVQDRLGYDRPSMAIDWLMKEAKAAIDALNATTTIEAFHRTPGDENQQISCNNCPFGIMSSRNEWRTQEEIPVVVAEEINDMDFAWNPNYNTGEGFAFVDREPLQSSYSPPNLDASNNEFVNDDGFLGFSFQQEIQVAEEENNSLE